MEAASDVLPRKLLEIIELMAGLAKQLNYFPTNSKLQTMQRSMKADTLTMKFWVDGASRGEFKIEREDEAKVAQLIGKLHATTTETIRRLDNISERDLFPFEKQYHQNTVYDKNIREISELLGLLIRVLPLGIPLPTALPRILDISAAESSRSPQQSLDQGSHIDASQLEELSSELAVPIRVLWRTCADTLSTLEQQTSSNQGRYAQLQSRLLLWGSGLFDNGTDTGSSDRALGSGPLGQHIFSLLIEIAVIIEHLFLEEISKATGSARAQLESDRYKLRVAMVGKGTTELGKERWLVLKSEEEIEIKPADAHLDYLDTVVDILYTVLPAIRGVRHHCLLEQEKLDEQSGVSAGPQQTFKMPVEGPSAVSSVSAPSAPPVDVNEGPGAKGSDVFAFDSGHSVRFRKMDLLEHKPRQPKRYSSRFIPKDQSPLKLDLQQWKTEASLQRNSETSRERRVPQDPKSNLSSVGRDRIVWHDSARKPKVEFSEES